MSNITVKKTLVYVQAAYTCTIFVSLLGFFSLHKYLIYVKQGPVVQS